LDFVLLPAEAVNDDLVFVDDVSAGELAERLPCPVHLSYDFADVLGELGSGNAKVVRQVNGAWQPLRRRAGGAAAMPRSPVVRLPRSHFRVRRARPQSRTTGERGMAAAPPARRRSHRPRTPSHRSPLPPATARSPGPADHRAPARWPLRGGGPPW